jgi:hypothetical protein
MSELKISEAGIGAVSDGGACRRDRLDRDPARGR